MKIKLPQDSEFSVYIYTNDHQPAHVHIFKPRNGTGQPSIKIELGDSYTPPKIVGCDPRINKKDIKAAWSLVAKNQEFLLQEWYRIHGFP